MRILLISAGGYGCWYLLRLQREGNAVDWWLPEGTPSQKRILKGLIPPPLSEPPSFKDYDLVIFDSTGHGELAEDIRKVTPVIGDGLVNSRLEDDRLFGLHVMEQCGIEVPRYARFSDPNSARAFIEQKPKRYVYKPFSLAEDQDADTTYVSESADDMLLSLEQLFSDSKGAPFLLQEVVEGIEVSTEAWYDGAQFYMLNHTIEEKKFMAGGYGGNTGCSGNLVWTPNVPTRLFSAGLSKLEPFLRYSNYHGMVDLNTIVNEQHVYGLEFTPRFGYDASPTLFSLISGNLSQFMFDIAVGSDRDPTPELRASWGAAARYTVPPYPEEMPGLHPKGIPIKGVKLEDAWLNFYLLDAMLDRRGEEEELCTAGVTGFVGCPIASGHTPEGAWDGVDRLSRNLKIPNMQVRCDLRQATLKRLSCLQEMGWA